MSGELDEIEILSATFYGALLAAFVAFLWGSARATCLGVLGALMVMLYSGWSDASPPDQNWWNYGPFVASLLPYASATLLIFGILLLLSQVVGSDL